MIKKTKLISLLFLVLFVHSFVSAQSFRAGAAKRVITPDRLIPISGGMGEPVMPEGKMGDLFVRAFVLEKNGTRVAIVSVDNLGWPAYLGDMSRKLVKGIPASNILIGATHTHSAPDAYGFPDEKGNTGADLKYLEFCITQIADAINEAVANLQSVYLKTAVGEARGKIAYNYYAEKLYDPRCGIIQAIASAGKDKGKTVATLVNYAIHPEVLGTGRKTLSPDLCGPLYERIESKAGGMAIFMNSAQGGMVTADTRLENGKEANDWNECIRIGNLLADEALRIIEPAPVQEDPELYCTAKIIHIPVDTEEMRYVFQYSPVAIKYRINSDNFSSVSTQINLLNIGKAQVITIPGEALPNIGFYIKRKMKSDQAFLFGLTNDAFGYMLTKEDFGSFERYEYISRTSLGEMTGNIIEDEAIRLINESPLPSK
ncbi:MAG: hypothetical protein IPN67_22025 [Bacteroidales bacterium]|nr:hypothetical protein [Bacteroidales bacterium]MBK8884926.1 hypothetical protein [Bacteroidales bacterium]